MSTYIRIKHKKIQRRRRGGRSAEDTEGRRRSCGYTLVPAPIVGRTPAPNVRAEALEVLGEKALAEGHIDLLLKERVPLGSAMKIPIEVKTRGATPKDVEQLRNYMAELQGESPVAILVAEDFGKKAIAEANDSRIKLVRYEMTTDLRRKASFEEIYRSLSLKPLTK